jgi:hypothetical protein
VTLQTEPEAPENGLEQSAAAPTEVGADRAERLLADLKARCW